VLSAPGLTHRWNDPAQYEDSAGSLVLGRYLMTTDKRGGLSSTHAASAFDATLRDSVRDAAVKSRAMVNSAREPLKREIEVDAWVAGLRPDCAEAGLEDAGFKHVPRSQPLRTHLKGCEVGCGSSADPAIGNLHQRLIGTHHGVSREHPQVYLDELVFRPTDAGCRWRFPNLTRPRSHPQGYASLPYTRYR
jgi:hypothetical protein